jgi:hydrogenase nickel incorporation protein HypB
LKYPTMFETSQLCIINKTDLLPYVNFDVEKAKEYALRINPNLEFIELSATMGIGFNVWLDWLEKKQK